MAAEKAREHPLDPVAIISAIAGIGLLAGRVPIGVSDPLKSRRFVHYLWFRNSSSAFDHGCTGTGVEANSERSGIPGLFCCPLHTSPKRKCRHPPSQVAF